MLTNQCLQALGCENDEISELKSHQIVGMLDAVVFFWST